MTQNELIFQFHQGLSWEVVNIMKWAIYILSIPSRIIFGESMKVDELLKVFFQFHQGLSIHLSTLLGTSDYMRFQFHQGLSINNFFNGVFSLWRTFNSIKDYHGIILRIIQRKQKNFQFHQGLSRKLMH